MASPTLTVSLNSSFMNATATQALITGAVTDFGLAALAVITATIALGVGYLVFRFGWSKVKSSLR